MKDNKRLFCTMALAATFILAMTPVSYATADEMVVPVGAQADRNHADFPRTGTTQASVRAKWGEPRTIQGPVGKPAITQWVYQNFIVYFEGNRVLHTVLKQHRGKK
jgi:hypothetical protein